MAILIAILAGISLACSKQEADPAGANAPDGRVLRFDVFAPIGSLNPKPHEGGGAHFVDHFLYAHLFAMNDDGQLEPDLATAWSYDRGSFTWTLQIRKGAQFHDGSPVTASDVEYTLRFTSGAPHFSEYLQIDRMDVTGEGTILVHLKKDDPEFLQKIFGFGIRKQPKTKDNNDSSTPPVGSGPFKFDYRIGNSEVGLTANEHYYRGRPGIDRVVFHYQPDKERSWARLLAGKTDVVLGLEPQDYQITKHYEDRFYFKTTIDPFIVVLLFNAEDVCLSDSRVRNALSLAIDRQNIVRSILRGMGVVPPDNLGRNASSSDPELKPAEYDPSKSMELLRQAGWTYDRQGLYLQRDGKPFELTILLNEENRLHRSIARFIQLGLNDLGIKVHVQPLPFNEFEQRYRPKADFQAAITEFSDTPSVSGYLSNLLFWDEKQAGRGCLANPRISGIAYQLDRETDPSKRRALLEELNSLLGTFQPAALLVQKTSLEALSKRFVLPCSLSNRAYLFKLWQVSPVSG